MLIKFTKGPTGAFNLAYSEGDTAEVRHTLALEIIEMGFGEQVFTEETATIEAETPETNKKKGRK
jgi:hypothetical protein